MKRHKKEEKMQALGKLYNESRTLFVDEDSEQMSRYSYRYRDMRMTWVPVEEPQFIGWEAQLVLSDAALRRQDADILQRVLHHLKASGKHFFKSEATVKFIRKCGRRYNTITSQWREFRRLRGYKYWLNDTPEGVVDIYKCNIKCAHYSELTEREKKYFVRCTRTYPATSWRDSFVEEWYQIDWHHFPIGDLMVKVDKAYSTHRGIPKADAISRESEIDDILDREFYRTKRWGRYYSRWTSWEKDMQIRSTRKAFKTALKAAVNDPEPDLAADEILAKRLKHKV